MMASASVSGGILFVPKHIEKQIPQMANRLSNDNQDNQSEQNT